MPLLYNQWAPAMLMLPPAATAAAAPLACGYV